MTPWVIAALGVVGLAVIVSVVVLVIAVREIRAEIHRMRGD